MTRVSNEDLSEWIDLYRRLDADIESGDDYDLADPEILSALHELQELREEKQNAVRLWLVTFTDEFGEVYTQIKKYKPRFEEDGTFDAYPGAVDEMIDLKRDYQGVVGVPESGYIWACVLVPIKEPIDDQG